MSEKRLSKETNRAKSKSPPTQRPKIRIRDISKVGGEVNIAARDIIKNIQTIYERALSPAETAEKELQIELKELAQGVRGYLERLKQQVIVPTTSAPYKGLEAYTLSDAEVFFGRDQAIRDLREAMRRGPLTVLQAESGAGKTSLLQAGIVPHLMAEEHLAVLIRPQFENPTDAIKKSFIGNLGLTPKLARASLVDFLRRVKGIIGHHIILYVILDQFEEFFAKYTLEEDRQLFILDLAECLNDATLNVRWVISITTDSFGQLGKFEPHIRNPFSNAQSLYLFNQQEAAAVIAKPAQRHGLSFEEGLLEQLLNDLGHDHNELTAPTQIQLVCAALYDDIKDKSTVFTRALYDQKGGAQGILRGYIGSVLRHDLPHEERAAAYKILEALVTSEKKRVIRAKIDLETALKGKGIASEMLESTLNHLVSRRLLRRLGDDAEHIQYEIVHDYLLREIEINEDVRNAKEAEELLDQGLRNWNRQNLLLAPGALKIIEARSADLPISSGAAKLLFLSAIEYARAAERWGELISAEDQKNLIDSLLSKKSTRKNREALWSLRRYLTKPQRTRIAFTRTAFAILAFLLRGVVLLLIGAALFVIGRFGIDSTNHFEPWTEMTSFTNQCLDGNDPSDLLVAVDAMDKSHVVVYEPRSHTFCETKNTGSTWTHDADPLPAGLTINSIAVNSSVYLATDQGLYYQDRDSTWRNVKQSAQRNSALQEIAIASEDKQIYVSNELGLIYRYNLTTGNWEDFPAEGFTGRITDITVNYDYFALSTADGIWYRKISSGEPWEQFVLKENVTLAAMEMVHPVRSWEHYFSDPTDDDWFLATTEQGEIYFGYLTESGGLLKMDGQMPALDALISSLAVNEYSKFMAGPGGLYCEQSWVITDSEWWLRFSGNPPCK